jgi:hypothetical protein
MPDPIDTSHADVNDTSQHQQNPGLALAAQAAKTSANQMVDDWNHFIINTYQHQLESAHLMRQKDPAYPLPPIPKLYRANFGNTNGLPYPITFPQDVTYTPPADPNLSPVVEFSGSPIGLFYRRNLSSNPLKGRYSDFYLDASAYRRESTYRHGDMWNGEGPGIGPYRHATNEADMEESPFQDSARTSKRVIWHLWEDLGSISDKR